MAQRILHLIFIARLIHSVFVDPYPSRVAVLIFTGHRLGELSQTLHQFNTWLDKTWTLQVFHSHISAERIRNETRNMTNDRLVLSQITAKDVHNRDSLNSFMVKNVSFWEACVGDKILIFQPDAAICTHSPYFIDMFLPYDYIGAPLPMIYFPGKRHKEWINAKEDNDFYGGNGGFSLRTKASMIACAQAALNGSCLFPEIPGEQEVQPQQ